MDNVLDHKDSGIEWVGDVPFDWKTLRLKHILKPSECRSVTGDEELLSITIDRGVVKRSEYIGSNDQSLTRAETLVGYKFVQKSNLVNNIMKMSFKCLGVSRYEGIVSPAYSVFKVNRDVADPRFLHELLRIDLYVSEYRKRSKGIQESRMRLYDDYFLDIKVALPPLREQAQISKFLDKKTSQIDSLIEKIQKKIELLKEQQSALISQCVTKGLDSNVEMKDSGVEWIGEIPSHWEFGRMKFQLSRNDGGVWGENLENNDEGTIVIRSTEISIDGKWDLSNPVSRSITASEFQKCQLKEGDIVVTKSSGSFKHIGKSVVVNKRIEGLNCCYSNFVQRIRFKRHLPKLYHYILNSYIVREQYRFQTQSTTGLGNLNRSSLDEILLPLIPLYTQFQISQYLDKKTSQFDSLIEKLQRKIVFLKEYQQSLISNVVTGKVKVTEDAP